MDKELLLNYHFHFIGIGGIGMSALAMALFKKGFSVSGSDLIKNNEIIKLEKSGVTIFYSQNKQNIEFLRSKLNHKLINCVVSSAIKPENKELIYCKNNKLKIKHRSEILSLLMQSYTALAIAGSHGKTTTSTFLSTLLELCTHNSSSITGGIIPIYDSNAHIEDTRFLVAEVDESDGTISRYNPDIGIINNIDFDHCDYFYDLNAVLSSFREFASNSKKLLLNFDCDITKKNFTSDNQWSIKETNKVAFSIKPILFNKNYTIGEYYEKGNFIDKLNIPIPGIHNLSNITASIAASRMVGVEFKDIKRNIQYLKLPKRRFQFRGVLNGRKVYDDYAHHPNEIKATIDLARLFINDNNKKEKCRLVVIFQPHRYSRVKQFFYEFAEELSKADVIYLTNIYSAGELNKDKINSDIITDIIYKKNRNVKHVEDYNYIVNKFFELTQTGDLILNMGAGDCNQFWTILNSKNK